MQKKRLPFARGRSVLFRVENLKTAVAEVADRVGFSGVVRVDSTDGVLESAFGLADRAHRIPITPATRFGIASGVKGITALTVMALVDRGMLTATTTARSVLGSDLPLIDDRVTVEHLLAHRSGIGDYVDEDAGLPITEYALPIPVQRLTATQDYFLVLGGHQQKFEPGEGFSYCNGDYAVLAAMLERVTGETFADLVRDLVCRPAGMTNTAFLRSDELPGDAAVGYLSGEGLRSNIFHLPVLGSGDGGLYSTAADISSLWVAMFDGRIVPLATVADMIRPRSTADTYRYGMGFWLRPAGTAVLLEGYDAGASFRSVHDPTRAMTHTVVSNTTDGAWPVTDTVAESLSL